MCYHLNNKRPKINNYAAKNNTSAIERVDARIAHIGISQAAFARRCGVEPSNLNKRLSSEVKFTNNYFAKIAHAFNQMLDANTSPVSQNIISGDNYQGVQTINATEGKITALEQNDAVRKIIDYVNSDKA